MVIFFCYSFFIYLLEHFYRLKLVLIHYLFTLRCNSSKKGIINALFTPFICQLKILYWFSNYHLRMNKEHLKNILINTQIKIHCMCLSFMMFRQAHLWSMRAYSHWFLSPKDTTLIFFDSFLLCDITWCSDSSHKFLAQELYPF